MWLPAIFNRNKQNNKNKTINNVNSNVFVIDKYNFLKKGIHLQFGTKHNKKIKDEDRHLLYLSIIELLDILLFLVHDCGFRRSETVGSSNCAELNQTRIGHANRCTLEVKTPFRQSRS